jgi:Domain of unknown function (DUF4158)
MQFYLNGYKPGDPFIEDPHPSVAKRPRGLPQDADVVIIGCGPAGLVLAVRDRYFPDFQDDDPTIANGTRLKQQRLILELCNYRSWNAGAQKKLDAKARQAAMICAKPIYVFRELIHYLADQRMVAPGYSIMQDTVGRALVHEQRRLASIVQSHLGAIGGRRFKGPARRFPGALRNYSAQA